MQQEQYLIDLSAIIRDVVLTISTEGIITSLNPGFEDISGWPRERWIGRHFAGLVHPEDLPRAQEYLRRALADESNPPFELRIALRDGGYFVAEFNMSEQVVDGRMVGFIGIARDVTERKNMEAALRQSEERYRLIVDTSQEGIWIRDHRGIITFANKRMAEMLGYHVGELIGQPILDFVGDEGRSQAVDRERNRRPGVPELYDLLVRRKDGGEVWTLVSASGIYDEEGNNLGALGMVTDITERKLAADQLSDSEARKAAILDTALDAIITFDPAGRIVEFNRAAERIFGFSRDEAIGKLLSETVWPPRVARAMSRAHEQFLRTGQSPMLDRRMNGVARRADGSEFPIEMSITSLEQHGQQLLTAYVRDMSEQKRIEAAHRQSEERFRSAFDHSPLGMAMITPDGTYLKVNPALCAMVGYSEQELVGRHYREITHPDDLPIGEENSNQALSGATENFQVEKRYIHKQGHIVWVTLNAAILRDENGAPLYWVTQVQDITGRREAEAALRESENRYRSLFEHSLDAILLSAPDGRILAANPAASRIFGRSEEELKRVGRAGIVDPTDPRLAVFLAERLREGEAKAELTHLRGDGGTFEGEVTSTLFRDSQGQLKTSLIIRDSTERKRNEEALRRSEERFRAAFDYAATGMALVDLSGRWIQVNQSLLKILGYSEEELLSKTFQDVTHPADLEADLGYVRQLLTGEISSYQMEKRYFHKQGHSVWVLLSVSLLFDGEDQPLHFIAQIQDISARKRAEADLSAALAQQQVANKQLAELSKAKSDFLSVISHEFRTPLTSIRGFSELLRDEELDGETIVSFAAEINKAAVRLNRMITEILDLDRMESGRMPLHRDTIDLNRIIAEEAETARPNAPKHPITVELDESIPPFMADGAKLAQVMTNLLSNAIKYSPKGGAVVVTSKREGDQAHVSVRDHGIGIPADHLDRVFERYARVESSTTRGIQGTGLGLPIVKQIVEMHGGRVWIESTPGEGATFHLTIPIATQ